jgi:quinol monooxygenase YgiN
MVMSNFDKSVSIHPYFKIKQGQMDACKAFLAQFNAKVANEYNCLYYNFTLKGDVLCCREAYQNAEAVQEHLQNCGALLGEFLKIADLTRIELHGPAGELEKLKPNFADFRPDYFVFECGIGR